MRLVFLLGNSEWVDGKNAEGREVVGDMAR
jgi:hypothetical protein